MRRMIAVVMVASSVSLGACKAAHSDEGSSELRQINATQNESNLSYLVDGMFRAVECSFRSSVSSSLVKKGVAWRPGDWGVTSEHFTVEAFKTNYAMRKAIGTGGIWGAFLNRLDAPSTMFTDTHDEMVFAWRDAEDREQSVGLTVDLLPFEDPNPADQLSDPETRHVWTLSIKAHTIWLTGENGTATFPSLPCTASFDVNGKQMLIPGTGLLGDGVTGGGVKPTSF